MCWCVSCHPRTCPSEPEARGSQVWSQSGLCNETLSPNHPKYWKQNPTFTNHCQILADSPQDTKPWPKEEWKIPYSGQACSLKQVCLWFWRKAIEVTDKCGPLRLYHPLPLREWCGFLGLLVNASSDNQARTEQRELCGQFCHMALQKKVHHTRPQHPHVPMKKKIALQG